MRTHIQVTSFSQVWMDDDPTPVEAGQAHLYGTGCPEMDEQQKIQNKKKVSLTCLYKKQRWRTTFYSGIFPFLPF